MPPLTTFLDLSRRKYHDIAKRKLAGGLVVVMPYDLEQFRTWLRSISMGGQATAWRCAYCLVPLVLTDVQCDHAYPLARGGSSALNNLMPACRVCNQRKGQLTAVEFTAVKAKLAELGPAAEKYVLECLSLAGMARKMQAQSHRARRQAGSPRRR